MGLSWSGRSEDPHLYIRSRARPEHIRYYPPFRMAIPSSEANYPYITHPFAALITSFSSEELNQVNPARLACLIHAASVRSDLLGVKGPQAVLCVGCESSRLNRGIASETTGLEYRRGEGNSWCSGEMRRYHEEHRWRRRFSGLILTLMDESRGSEED